MDKPMDNLLNDIANLLEGFIKKSERGEGRVTNLKPGKELLDHFKLKEITTKDEFISLIEEYLDHSTNIHHPQYIGHQVAKPHIGSSIADMIHGVVNNSSAVYDMGQAGNLIENQVIHWLCSKVGWDDKSFGVLTAGGSMANLTSMLAARSHAQEDVWVEGNDDSLVALVPDISHYCVARTLSIMGLGSKKIIHLETDSLGKIKVEKMQTLIEELKEKGLKPFVIVANACSTSAGTHDDLESIGSIANENDIWFHVDAAHGGSALLSDKYKHLLQGVDKADSVVWDTHKMMSTSSLCGAALFKDSKNMQKVFHQKASYLNDGEAFDTFKFFPYTLECTKPVYGLKVYLMYALIGEAGFAHHIDSLYGNARDFFEMISEQEDFECPIKPESNIIIFKYLNNKDQKFLYDSVLGNGNFHITFTEFENEEWLRLTVMNPLTKRKHIEALFEEIRTLPQKSSQ